MFEAHVFVEAETPKGSLKFCQVICTTYQVRWPSHNKITIAISDNAPAGCTVIVNNWRTVCVDLVPGLGRGTPSNLLYRRGGDSPPSSLQNAQVVPVVLSQLYGLESKKIVYIISMLKNKKIPAIPESIASCGKE